MSTISPVNAAETSSLALQAEAHHNEQSRRTRRIALVLGGFALCFTLVTYGAAVAEQGWSTLGVMLWPAGLFAAGAAFGFLFAIPKVVQGAGADDLRSPLPAGNSTAPLRTAAATYRQQVNSNLVEISDWLTKIIVGVSLVELKPILRQVQNIADTVGQSFPGAEGQFRSMALAIVILFPAVGFLFGYLMTRLYVQPALFYVEHWLSGYFDERLQEVAQMANAAISTVTTGIGLRPTGDATTGSRAAAAIEARSVWTSDPHKGKFGGSNEANGRLLSARIEPILGDSREPCRVHLEVRSSDSQRPLVGKVQFFLHPTFDTPAFDVTVQNGVATYDIISFGVFTVGAEADGGRTKLELDLRKVPGGSAAFYRN